MVSTWRHSSRIGLVHNTLALPLSPQTFLACTSLAPTTLTLDTHVASATYVVSPAAQGKGIGRALVEHSIAKAQSDGFMAMQFNYVVATNSPAVELYKKLGFAIVGTLPKAFRHRRLGLVDAYVMFRFLKAQDA